MFTRLEFTRSKLSCLKSVAFAGAACLSLASISAQAAFIVEVDTDGLDDGVITFNPNFVFGNDTTSASQSDASTAFGTTGGDSIFGGDAVIGNDAYIFTYNPFLNPDNLVIPVSTDLGNGNLATGLTGGTAGTYNVYATWPMTSNVSGGDTNFTVLGVTDVMGTAVVTSTGTNGAIDQNGKGDNWELVGSITISDAMETITVIQTPTGSNTFVSMRTAGVLFECTDCTQVAVSEPASLALLGLGLAGVGVARRRK